MDAARTMMAEFKSPYNFWAKAINTACHASNRLYLRKGLNKTPYEILTGNKPNLKYFRVFGCKCLSSSTSGPSATVNPIREKMSMISSLTKDKG